MALQNFFTGLSDTDLAKKVIAGKPDVYIQHYVYEGTAVYANTTAGTSTLTPATSPAWTIDELISSVANNLLIVDGNGVVASAKVTDNTATALTFDETACLLENDNTTAATLVPGTTYNIYVLTPSSIVGNTYGPFFGYAENLELVLTDETMQFKYGQPKKTKFRDLMERTGTITGGHVNFTDKDLMTAIFNATEYGDNTGGKMSLGIGSGGTCATLPKYRLTFVATDRDCKTIAIIVRQVQFSADGNIFQDSADGYRMANINGIILSDGFYPGTADMVGVKRSA